MLDTETKFGMIVVGQSSNHDQTSDADMKVSDDLSSSGDCSEQELRQLMHTDQEDEEEEQEQQESYEEQQDDSLDSLEHLVAECSAALRLVKEQAGHQERLVKDQVGPQHLQPQDDDDQTPSLKPLAKVEVGLERIKQRLLTFAYFRLSIQDLKDLKEQSLGPVDPSIQFFGLEWTSVFSRLYSLGVEIRLLKAGLEQNRLSFQRLLKALQLVNQLEAELQMHAEAVSSGRLSRSHLNLQLRQQQTVTNIGRAASFRATAARGSMLGSGGGGGGGHQQRRKQPKYKGSRTDSALTTAEHRQHHHRQQQQLNSWHTTTAEKNSSKSRKNSFVDSLSSILRGSLKL